MSLSGGSIQRMVNNDTSIKPRLQILDVKKIVTGQQGERFRLVLSDGQFYIQGMLATQCTGLVANGQLKKWTIIHLKEFVCNNISGKKICVVIDCTVVSQESRGIGQPKNVLQLNNANPNQNNQNRPAPPQNQQSFNQRNNNNFNQNSNNYGNQRNNNNYGGNNGGNNRGNNGGNNAPNNNYSYNASNDANVQPVSSLNPYQNAWKIKVRCTNKDNMRHYHNQKGDGKFFGVDLLDKDGTEIRAVMFNDAADKFFSIFERNRVYLISKGQVRLAKKGYSHIKNDYSITLNSDADVVAVHSEDDSIQRQRYKFTKIAAIGQVEPKEFVDVIGIIVDVGPVTTIMSNRTQQENKRRNVKIADDTAKIDITLWNADATEFDEDRAKNTTNPVIALKACKVSAFGGRSLSAGGFIDFHPDLQETRALLRWVTNLGAAGLKGSNLSDLTSGGSGNGVDANAPRRTFAEIKEMKLGEKPDKAKADFFTVVASITTIAQSPDKKPWYLANPDPKSENKNAKVIPMGDGKYRCDKNGKVYDSYVPRYIMRFCATDFTGNVWLTSFNEVAEKILGKPASVAEKLSETNTEEYEQMFKAAQFRKYVFRCKAYSDVWEDSTRIRYDCVGVQPADPTVESAKLLEKIQVLHNLKANNANQNNNRNQGMNQNNNNGNGNGNMNMNNY